MKKNNVKTRIIGTALAAVCAVTTLAAVAPVGVSAASYPGSVSVSAQLNSAQLKAAKKCTFQMDGVTWTYWLKDNTNVDIDANINFNNGKVTFFIKGLEPGVVNSVLKTKRPDGKWNNVPVRFVVDNKLNVTGKQTGKLFVTNTKYEG